MDTKIIIYTWLKYLLSDENYIGPREENPIRILGWVK